MITSLRSQFATKPQEIRKRSPWNGVWVLALLGACAAPPAERPLLREAIRVLATQPLGSERVNWEAVQRELEAGIPADGGLAEERAAIHLAVARLGDAHARYIEPMRPVEEEAASSAPVAMPPIPILPEGSTLAGEVAYLLLPGCAAYEREAQLTYARRPQ